MIPYGPVTFALLYDLRVRGLSWAERGVLYHLYLLAAASIDEKTIAVETRAGEALVASWERALGKDGGATVGHLVEMGFVVSCHEGLRITIPARETAARGRAHVGTATDQGTDSEATQGGNAWDGKPSTSPSARRVRNDRGLFKARAKGMWKLTDPSLSWDEWLATADGVAFLAERENEHPGYGRVARQGSASEGSAGSTPKGSAQGSASGSATLEGLREASRGVADLVGPAYERSVSRVIAQAMVTDAEVPAFVSALSRPSSWWPADIKTVPARITLADLSGYRSAAADGTHECRPLLALIAHVRAQSTSKRPAVLASPGEPPMTEAQRADVRARLAAAIRNGATS